MIFFFLGKDVLGHYELDTTGPTLLGGHLAIFMESSGLSINLGKDWLLIFLTCNNTIFNKR